MGDLVLLVEDRKRYVHKAILDQGGKRPGGETGSPLLVNHV